MPHEDYCYALERENHALNEKYESLRQQLSDSQKREVMLRDFIEGIANLTPSDDADGTPYAAWEFLQKFDTEPK